MPAKRKIKVTKVTAFLPYSVDLTKLGSGKSLDIEVRIGDELLGRLLMGRGSVRWWPRGNKENSFQKTWKEFAGMLNDMVQ